MRSRGTEFFANHSFCRAFDIQWLERKITKEIRFCLPWIYYIQLCAPMCTVERYTPLQFRHNGTQKNEIKKFSFRIFNILFCVGVELLSHPSECRNTNGNCGNSYTASNPMQWYILFRSLISLPFASSAFRFSASIANLAKCRKKNYTLVARSAVPYPSVRWRIAKVCWREFRW